MAVSLACGGDAARSGDDAVDRGSASDAAVQDTQGAPRGDEDRRSVAGDATVPPPGTGARDAPRDAPRGTIVFLGTSLTAGLGVPENEAYPALIAARIDSAGLPYSVVNAGSSGETSAGALQRIDWVLEHREIAVLVLETGANDGLRGLDVAGTAANIDSIIRKVRSARPEALIFLVQMEAPPNLGDGYTRAFRAMYPTLAARHGAELVPFLLEGVAGVDTLNQGDGIHPNEAGHRVLAETVWGVLRGELESTRTVP